MNFSLVVHGLRLEKAAAGVRVSVEGDGAYLSAQALAECVEVMQMVQRLNAFGTGASAPTALPLPVVQAPTPTAGDSLVEVVGPAGVSAAADPAASHIGPTKRGPGQSAVRAGSVDEVVPQPVRKQGGLRAASHPATLTQRGKSRQRGALVRLMVEWFADNPGPRTLDEVVKAAEDGHWTQAQSVRPAIIAALRRTRKQIQRNADGTFQPATPTKKGLPPGRIVRRPRRR